MLVRDCMYTEFVNCRKEHTLHDVLQMFAQTYSNMLPVVDDDNKLIGIITKNKILKILASRSAFDDTIDRYYHPNPIMLHPNDYMDDARKLLLKHKIGHAPVVNNDHTPIGLLSTQQLISSYNLFFNQLETQFALLFNKLNFSLLSEVNKLKDVTYIEDTLNELHITKGWDPEQTYRGLTHLHEALEKVNILEKQVHSFQNELKKIKETKYTLFEIIGESAVMRKLKNEALLASKSMSTVLITGESGTGKELFAQGIHASSDQKGRFIQVNCAAIPPDLLESEFFGYADGAFTGAKKGGMKGKFELAQNGTIFLDEIGDMPLSLQTKLLRVLQEKEYQPIGSSKTIYLNTKVIAATNQNIEQMVANGQFREDLYYRLNIVRLNIPPLRERMEDVPPIIHSIVNRLNQSGFSIKGVTYSALTKLMQHSWPGNVRELQNVLERAANLTNNSYIDANNIGSLGHHSFIAGNMNTEQTISTFKDKVDSTEKDLIIDALKKANGNKTQASKYLGISRPWLYAKIKKYNISLTSNE